MATLRIKSTIKYLMVIYPCTILLGISSSCKPTPDLTVESPDKNLLVTFKLGEGGNALFQVSSRGQLVLDWSPLGIVYSEGAFSSDLELDQVSPLVSHQDDYELHHGKKSTVSYLANEQTIQLSSESGAVLGISFRVSNDGVAFQYILPESENEVIIQKELTGYNFPKQTLMYVQPMSVAKTGWQSTNPSYEEAYKQAIPVNTPSEPGAGWVYPALFEVGEDWVLITEAGLKANYCGTRLVTDSDNGLMTVGFPSEKEVFTNQGALPVYSGSATSPWRVLTIGSLETIVESTLGTDLADEAIAMDDSFVKPGIASWSWAVLKDNSVNYETTKEFIDYAQQMNWPYCLIDADWDTRIGEERVKELVAYGKERNVGLLLWYNSAGDWNSTPYHPKSELLTREQRVEEFSKLQEWGIKGVKIDFFGGDGQSMIAYYHDLLADAAEFDLLINFHGATLPRGWHRTYPHLMTTEAVKGFEFITFFQEVADVEANHSAMLPFTRNVCDPMDFTPMCFSNIPNIDRKTSNGFELALPTLFLSGIQHLAEIPQGMAAVPDYVQDYLKGLPVAWDETQFIEGFPGKLAVMARRSGSDWYVTGINGENVQKDLSLDLSFLKGKSGYLITDGEAHPEFERTDIQVNGSYPISIKANGGFVMRLK